MTTTEIFLIALLIIFTVPWLIWRLFRTDHYAPLVVVHSSFPQNEPFRTRWLARYAAYAVASGADPAQTEQARVAVGASLALLTPEEDETCLRDAGFKDVELFYAAFTWRGWVSRA